MKKEKAVKGGVYLTIVNVVSQLLSTVLSVILARLLAPEDFGLMALVLTFLGFIELFTKIGFGSAIIQKKNPSQTQISTLYWINLFFGVITLVIIIVGTPWFARFYDSPRLNEIMWIAALSVVITPTYMIHYKLLEKDLKFGLLSRANMVASICGAVGATLAALSGLGVIALIVQALVGKLTKGLIVLHGNSWRPSLIFNFSEVKDMLVFSLKFKLFMDSKTNNFSKKKKLVDLKFYVTSNLKNFPKKAKHWLDVFPEVNLVSLQKKGWVS